MSKQAIDELIELAAECRYDPHRWSLLAWDWGHGALAGKSGPREWQREINLAIRDHLSDPSTRFQPLQISIASGHGIGKSAQVGMLVNWALSTCDDAKVLITANTGNQLKTKTSPEVGKWNRLSITAPWFDVHTMSITSKDKEHAAEWRADFVTWSKDNVDAFAGLHNQGKRILLIFDEASGIHSRVWETAQGALTDEETEIIWIAFGNPLRNTGEFRECFRKQRDAWVHRQIDSRTVEGTNKALISKWEKTYGVDSDFFKTRVRGMFPAVSVKQLISTEYVDAARGRHLRTEQFNFAAVVLTCDPAWQGDDDLVIAKRQGLASWILRVIPKNDNDFEIATILAALEDEHDADAVFIDAGYGTGIYSAGKTQGRDWTLVWFSGKSSNPGCLNKRAEMWVAMRDWLRDGGSIPDDQELYDDLIGPETVPRSDGIIQLESKADMKDRGLPSPNRGDALALSFAFPVNKKHRGPRGNVADARRNYDPHSVLNRNHGKRR
ncbi:terminase [Methylomonas koyamae]|uniref:terminase n=1 Tax=Methylomonas koyamae TaxID=702114 RepID=UPI00112EC613|nr:terminase [Methylomonas koyamae]TPQ24926.1 terminase [Methylomonas koyamae]